MSNPWNSECVSPHMCFGGTPEEEGLFLPEHFLFRLLLLCLLIVRALCRVMIKGQYRNFIILHNDSCSLKPGSHVCLLVLTWPGRCWMQSSSGFWFCADQMSSSNTKPGNRVLYGSGFEDRSIVMLKQERDKHKLQTQSWKKSLCAVAFRFPHIVTWGELQTRSIQRVSTYFWLYGVFWMSSDSVLQSLICRSVAPVFQFWCVEQKHAAVIRLHSSNPDVWKKICVFLGNCGCGVQLVFVTYHVMHDKNLTAALIFTCILKGTVHPKKTIIKSFLFLFLLSTEHIKTQDLEQP